MLASTLSLLPHPSQLPTWFQWASLVIGLLIYRYAARCLVLFRTRIQQRTADKATRQLLQAHAPLNTLPAMDARSPMVSLPSWSAMASTATSATMDKKQPTHEAASKRKKAQPLPKTVSKPATRSVGVQTSPDAPGEPSLPGFLLPRLDGSSHGDDDWAADERQAALGRLPLLARSSYASVTSSAQSGTIAQRRHHRNMSSLSSIQPIPEREKAAGQRDGLSFSSPSSRDASSLSSSSFISDKSSAATTADSAVPLSSTTPDLSLPCGLAIDGLMQGDTPRPNTATAAKSRKKKPQKWVPGMPKPADQEEDAYWSQDPKGRLDAATSKQEQRRPSAASAEVPPPPPPMNPPVPPPEAPTLPSASVQGLRSVSQPAPFRPMPPFALHIPYGSAPPPSPHPIHPILMTPHSVATPGSTPLSPPQPRQMIPVSPQHLMQMLNFGMGTFQTPEGSPYLPHWGQASTSAQPSPVFPPQYLRPDQQSVSRQTSHSSLHSSAQGSDQTKLVEQLAALEAKVKAAEVENERKSKELEIAMWRLECIEHEYEKETQAAIRVYAKKAEAAQQRVRKLERKAKEAEQKDHDAESRCSSMSDTSTSAIGSMSQLDLSSSHGGESVSYSPHIKPLAGPSRLDLSMLSNGSFGSQSNYYPSPTGPMPGYFGFPAFHPSYSSSPRLWRGKKKKKQNGYRVSSDAPSPNMGRFNDPSLRQHTNEPMRPLNTSGSTATPHGMGADDDSDDDLVVVLEEPRSSTTLLAGQREASPTLPDEELPIGLGFDLASEAEEDTAVVSPTALDTPRDCVGTLPRFWRAESFRRASTHSDPGPITDGACSA